ncbi:hypothetical protein [Caryophanon latum]|uniref:HTH merR-type domain-containing protein n=1 Tax=Caryophanon latum TaxID=33977 RepID=A0A1C0YUE4_9BACL|nr:hypothetical protein [Caryophanon latum]OCS90785.1 hypothetical protein A6K76_01670 [Caryophanon latum]
MTATYALHQLAPLLQIEEQAILHYIDLVRQQGYTFFDSEQNEQFSADDVKFLQTVLMLEREHGFQTTEAIRLVLSPTFDITTLEKPEKRLQTLPKSDESVHHLSQSIELLATHISKVELQNEQLLKIIEAQQTQQEALFEQNEILKQQLQLLSTSIGDQGEQQKNTRQLDRLEQQNAAVMNLLNRVNTQLHDQEIAKHEEQKQQVEVGFFKRLFSKL